jgi:hypothetical protein
LRCIGVSFPFIVGSCFRRAAGRTLRRCRRGSW